MCDLGLRFWRFTQACANHMSVQKTCGFAQACANLQKFNIRAEKREIKKLKA